MCASGKGIARISLLLTAVFYLLIYSLLCKRRKNYMMVGTLFFQMRWFPCVLMNTWLCKMFFFAPWLVYTSGKGITKISLLLTVVFYLLISSLLCKMRKNYMKIGIRLLFSLLLLYLLIYSLIFWLPKVYMKIGILLHLDIVFWLNIDVFGIMWIAESVNQDKMSWYVNG